MTTFAEQVVWQTLAQAKERAAREGRPVLLDFSAAPV
jgi:hypothetical protein